MCKENCQKHDIVLELIKYPSLFGNQGHQIDGSVRILIRNSYIAVSVHFERKYAQQLLEMLQISHNFNLYIQRLSENNGDSRFWTGHGLEILSSLCMHNHKMVNNTRKCI